MCVWLYLCIYAHSCKCACGCVPCVCSLTICARRYICAWLAVRVGLDGLPSRTACWDILVGVELMLWARLISWAAAGEVVRLIYREMNRIISLCSSFTLLIFMSIYQFPLNNMWNIQELQQEQEFVNIFTAHRATSVTSSFLKASWCYNQLSSMII